MRPSAAQSCGAGSFPLVFKHCANPAELRIVKSICQRRAQGMSYAAIAEQLQNDGVATKTGGRWYASTVRAILERREKLAA